MLVVKCGKSYLLVKVNFFFKRLVFKYVFKYKDEVIKFVEEYSYYCILNVLNLC